MKKTAIINGNIITGDNIENGNIFICDGKITDINYNNQSAIETEDIEIIDAKGLFVAPGFIDIHVHGGGGREVNEGEPSAIEAICSAHARYGTTAILPTVMSDTISSMGRSVEAVKTAYELQKIKPLNGSVILGVHLEGPYLAPTQRGAQSADAIKPPDPKDYIPLLDIWDGIKMMGVAPELPGVLALAKELKKRRIVASIAHSDAEFDEVVESLKWGFSDLTHIYSGCSTVHRRNAFRFAGVVEAGLLLDELTVQVIADGKHLPGALLKLIYKCKGREGIALITDALSYACSTLQEGVIYTQSNGVDCLYEDGVMKLTDRQSFAGSTATTNILVKNMMELADVSLSDSVYMASTTPAKILGIKNKGKLKIGNDADIAIFDNDIKIHLTMAEGNIIFQENKGVNL